MKHKYLKETVIDNSEKRATCKVCGCERIKITTYGYTSYSYLRSGIFFELAPDCIDMEKENLKTID